MRLSFMAGCSLSPFSYLCFGGCGANIRFRKKIEKFLVYTSDVLYVYVIVYNVYKGSILYCC